MPVLLAPDQAMPLPGLLKAANTAGLSYQILPDSDPMPAIRGLGSLQQAGPTEISFLSNPRLAEQLVDCRAAAVILTPDVHKGLSFSPAWRVILCAQPYLLYALLAQWFDQQRLSSLPGGIHPSAIVHPSAQIGDGVAIGPNAVIEAGVSVGARSRVGAACVLGTGSQIGTDALLHARVTLYHDVIVGNRVIIHSGAVLGADGFGFAPLPGDAGGAWAKIAQLGKVVVGDDVEIGANTTIDRGALDNTVVGNGVKLDNQIMVAHNVQIGEHTAIAACVGIAGSTVIGQRCTIGGAAMLSGHIRLEDDVHVSGGTAITSNVTQAGRYTGVYPFADHSSWQRNAAVLAQLAQLRQRLRKLEKPDNL